MTCEKNLRGSQAHDVFAGRGGGGDDGNAEVDQEVLRKGVDVRSHCRRHGGLSQWDQSLLIVSVAESYLGFAVGSD